MRPKKFGFLKLAISMVLVVGLLTVGSLPFFSRDHVKNETIEATAMGPALSLATPLERVAAAIKKTRDPALLGNAGLVPINDVDELPGIFAELEF